MKIRMNGIRSLIEVNRKGRKRMNKGVKRRIIGMAKIEPYRVIMKAS